MLGLLRELTLIDVKLVALLINYAANFIVD